MELARAGTRRDMLIAVAAELGLDTQRVPAIEDIGAAFAASRYLLVFDNAEHIVDLVANLVETLTSCAGSLRVLVTSREPLHISAEAVLRMARSWCPTTTRATTRSCVVPPSSCSWNGFARPRRIVRSTKPACG